MRFSKCDGSPYGFLVLAGLAGWLVVPALIPAAAQATAEFETPAWTVFVLYWGGMATAFLLVGVWLWSRHRAPVSGVILRGIALITLLLMAVALAWFVLVLPRQTLGFIPVGLAYAAWSLLGYAALAVYAPQAAARLSLALLGLAIALGLVEVALRATARVDATALLDGPAYDVLFLEPHPVVGWTQVPDFAYIWTGRNPDCITFRTPVTTNSYGFRDVEWAQEKPAGAIRIALIGDSFVEAIQVPLELTAAQRLEARLSAALARPVEVMNFGISSYSVAQYLMVYDEFIRAFHPDYVFILVADFNMTRTMQRSIEGTRPGYVLNIRPSYTLDAEGELVYLPPEQYEEYVAAVQRAIETRYGADRSVELYGERGGSFAENPLGWLRRNSYAVDLLFQFQAMASTPSPAQQASSPDENAGTSAPSDDRLYVDLNYHIIETLNTHLNADGGQLVFVDAFAQFAHAGMVERNRQFSEAIGAGFIDLSARLADADGPVRWPCDNHFNVLGNEIFASAMADWFVESADIDQP